MVAMMPCGHRCVCERCAASYTCANAAPNKSSSNRPATPTRRPAGPKDALGSDVSEGSPEIDDCASALERGFSDIFQQVPLCPMCRVPVEDTKRIYG